MHHGVRGRCPARRGAARRRCCPTRELRELVDRLMWSAVVSDSHTLRKIADSSAYFLFNFFSRQLTNMEPLAWLTGCRGRGWRRYRGATRARLSSLLFFLSEPITVVFFSLSSKENNYPKTGILITAILNTKTYVTSTITRRLLTPLCSSVALDLPRQARSVDLGKSFPRWPRRIGKPCVWEAGATCM